LKLILRTTQLFVVRVGAPEGPPTPFDAGAILRRRKPNFRPLGRSRGIDAASPYLPVAATGGHTAMSQNQTLTLQQHIPSLTLGLEHT